MYIKSLQTLYFRNYDNLSLNLCPNVNVFIGDNAQGKTNILELIYYCGFAKSHRTNKDKDIIKWNCEETFIRLDVHKKRLDKIIDIKILKDVKKAVKINSIKVNKIGELIGTFNVVIFSPEDLKIVKESPGIRRKFMDMEISQLNVKYYNNLVNYNKILSERNSVLKCAKIDESMLDIYDMQLAQYGEYIIKARLEYLNSLNKYSKQIHSDITSGKEEINFEYISNVKNLDNIKESLLNLLRKSRKKDIEKRITSIGPHKDDFSILLNGVDAKAFGSQGQQRTSVLTIKFASLKIIKEVAGEYPVLLLDDVLSELDFSRKSYILKSINSIQTIITCTGIEDLTRYLDEHSKIFIVKDGIVKE